MVLCVAHLNPHDSRRRVHEAKRILTKHAKPQMDSNKGFLLVGDLNTLSPLDKAHHELAGLTSKIRTGPYAKPLGKKFLNHQVSATHKQASSVSDLPSSHNPLLSLLCYLHTSQRSAVDYQPMKVLLDAPLTDIGAVYSGRDLASSGSQITVPTSINADHMHFAQLRLDYALASKGLIEASEAAAACNGGGAAAKAALHAAPLRDDRTNSLSDHFPLLVTF